MTWSLNNKQIIHLQRVLALGYSKVIQLHIYICVCVCVYVCMCVYIHTHIFPSPGYCPNPGIKPGSPALQADSFLSELPEKRTYTHTHTHTHIYIYIYTYTHTYISFFRFSCTYLYMYVYKQTYIHIYILFQILFPYRLLQDIESNSLPYTGLIVYLFHTQQCVYMYMLIDLPSPIPCGNHMSVNLILFDTGFNFCFEPSVH